MATPATALDTPYVSVDLDKFERNLRKLQDYLSAHHIANRPHFKTHKIPEIARMQVAGGAVGLTAQKLGEAEVLIEGGIFDILIPYNIVGEIKLRRLADLMQRARISVAADSAETVRGLSQAATWAGVTLPVLVEVDTGMKRCGVQGPHEAAALARTIQSLPGLHFGGLMFFPANEILDPTTDQVRELLAPDGIAVASVSGGSTAGMWQAHTHRNLNEYRSGMYVYGDLGTITRGAMTQDEVAFTVTATVVSRPTHDRGILDCGSKTLSSDTPRQGMYGRIVEYPEAVIYGLSEEHGHVDFAACSTRPKHGERVTVIPNHCCPVTNLTDTVIGLRGGMVELTWTVAARGKVK